MSRDALKKLEELSQMSQLYDAKNNLSSVLQTISNNRILKQIRLNSNLAKGIAFGVGKDKVDSMTGNGMFDNIVNTSAYASVMGFPTSGSIAAASALEAQKRAIAARQGSNKNGVVNNYDTAAASLNSMKNIGNTGKNLFYTNTALAGVAGATGHTGLQHFAQGGADAARGSFMMGPGGGGLLGAKLMGGVSGMGEITGGAMSKLLATAGIQGVAINPMLAGVATMMALSKGTSALHKMVNDKSSLGQKKAERSTIFHRKHPHQLEDQYGSVMLYQNLIAKLQSTGQIDTQTAILGQIMAAIEGHTSVLPLIAAEIINEQKSREKNTNKSLNSLSDKFGDDGKLSRNDQSKRNDPGLFFKIASKMEKFSTTFQSTFDIMTQVSNTLNGKSTTALANEARDFGKTGDLLEAQKEFGRKYGVSTGMVQAIHTTPSQIMDQADSYEGRVLSILGLISEINRFSAHELLQIRTKGFGLSSAESTSYLAKAQLKIEEQRQTEDGYNETYERWFRGIDEKLGLIPGWNVLSGSVKMLNSGLETIKFLGSDDPKNKSVGQYFNDWILKGHENVNLGSEEQLKSAIGAKELSAEQRMASYLGFDYPNKFEELLDHIKRIDESTAAAVGPINRTGRASETMNNFTGLMGDNNYHNQVNDDILSKLADEFNSLDDSNATVFQQIFGMSDTSQKMLKRAQRDKFLENNPDFMNNLSAGMDNDGGSNTVDRNYSSDSSLQGIQEQQDEAARKERQLSNSEKQLITLLEIRDILKDGPNQTKSKTQPSKNGVNNDYAGLLDNIGFDTPDIDLDIDGNKNGSNKNKRVPPKADGKTSKFKKWFNILEDFDNTRGGSAASQKVKKKAAGLVAKRLLAAGIGVMTGPIGLAVGAAMLAYSAYEIYDIITEQNKNDQEERAKQAEEIRNSDARSNYNNLDIKEKEHINVLIAELEKFDPKKDMVDLKSKLSSMSETELLNIKAALGSRDREISDLDAILLGAINEILDQKMKQKNQNRQNKNAFVLDANNNNNLVGQAFMSTALDQQSKSVQDKFMNTEDNDKTISTLSKTLSDWQNMGLTQQDYKNIATYSKSATYRSAAAKLANMKDDFGFFGGRNRKMKDDEIQQHAKLVGDGMTSDSNVTIYDKSVNVASDFNNMVKFDNATQKALATKANQAAYDDFKSKWKELISNVDSKDKDGKNVYGITASEQKQLEQYAKEFYDRTDVQLSGNLNQVYQILSENAMATKILAESINKLVNNKTVVNSDLNKTVVNSND